MDARNDDAASDRVSSVANGGCDGGGAGNGTAATGWSDAGLFGGHSSCARHQGELTPGTPPVPSSEPRPERNRSGSVLFD